MALSHEEGGGGNQAARIRHQRNWEASRGGMVGAGGPDSASEPYSTRLEKRQEIRIRARVECLIGLGILSEV